MEICKYPGYDILPHATGPSGAQASTPPVPTCPYYLPCEPWQHEGRKQWPRHDRILSRLAKNQTFR